MVWEDRASITMDTSGDFAQYLENEGVNKSTLERLKKEAITDWETLSILTSDDLSELGLPIGQKAIIRKLTQRQKSSNETEPRDLRVMSTVQDKARESKLSETASEYAVHRDLTRDDDDDGDDYDDAFTVTRQDDIYDDAISLDQHIASMRSQHSPEDDEPPEKPPRYPTTSHNKQKPDKKPKAFEKKPPISSPAVEDTGDIYDVPEDEDMTGGGIQDDVYDVPEDTDGGDIYDEAISDSPPQPQITLPPRTTSYPKPATKQVSGTARREKSAMKSETTRGRSNISEPARASRNNATSDSTRFPRSNMTSESTVTSQADVTSENQGSQTIAPETILLPKAGGGASHHISKLISVSGDNIINAAKHIMKFDTKPAVRPTIVKVEATPMGGSDSVPNPKPAVQQRLSGGFSSDSGSSKQTAPDGLPPRALREQSSSKGVHFPEDMLLPTNDKPTVMSVRQDSIPDEEAPDIPRRSPKNRSEPQQRSRDRVTTKPVKKIKEDNSGEHEVELNVSCLETERKGKIILELTTVHEDVVKPLPARILLLVDTSGSMGIKVGRRRLSKLTRLKKFVISMVKTLDEGDQAALVTFGEESSVLLPMSEINDGTQDTLTTKLDELDKSFLSKKTDLSAGLMTSLDVFGRVCKSQEDLLGYRNSIIVFSDGEINLGTQEPSRLVHEVREKIRAMSFGLDNTQNQWVSISTVVTGSSPSEIMYSLSKFCSSDAFYHLDIEKSSKTDVDLFLPVMMRKTAIAWNVSLHVKSLNGATIINADCTQENKVRLRGHKTAEGEKTEKAYFFYDIPAASEKHVGIVIDLYDVEQRPDVKVLSASINFTGISGKRRSVTREVTLADLMPTDESKKKEALEDIYMHEARIVSQIAVNKAAEEIKTGRAEKSRTRLIEGQSDLQRLMESYGQKAQEEDVKIDITPHAESVIKNLQSLLDAIEESTGNDEDANGKNWNRMKAVSSAITREAPTISETVDNTDILCPLPRIKQINSDNIREQMVHVYRKQGVRNSSFVSMDHTIVELGHSLRMRPISE
ncbi:uncharacterized protein [Argopecten irradians]|uniref:uncharacterized protein isoform X3 n=1 Tax=Argopecten irradians TaxID=31199 RepID=UPI0037123CC8